MIVCYINRTFIIKCIVSDMHNEGETEHICNYRTKLVNSRLVRSDRVDSIFKIMSG